MTTKAFVILLLACLVLGVALGGAFAGGFALGKSGDPAQTAGSLSMRPPAGSQAGFGARAGQAPAQPGDDSTRSGAQSGQAGASDGSADRSEQQQGADGIAAAGNGPTNGGDAAAGVQDLFGAISSLQGDLVILDSPRGPAQAAISETTVIQKTVAGSVDDLSVGATVQVSGRPGEDGLFQARSLTLAAAGDDSVSLMPAAAGRRGPGGEGSLTGTIEQVADGSITVAGADGMTRVALGPNAAVWKLEAGDRSDLAEGASIHITGAVNSEGQVQANVVTVVPERAGRGGRRGFGDAAPQSQ